MDKETLSNYGWIVICVLVIAVMVALATPFGNYVKSAVESTTQGLYDTSAGAINSTDLMHIAGQSFNNGDNGSSSTPVAYNHDDPALHPTGTIPTNATYIIASTSETLSSGSSFPLSVSENDVYKYREYTYTYKSAEGGWQVTINQDVTDKFQTQYSSILESISGINVTSLKYTFSGCHSLTSSPAIPINVTNISQAFYACYALETAPELPNGITNLQQTFYNCYALTDLSEYIIPDTVEYMSYAFQGCTGLTSAPVIPSGVRYIKQTFDGCTSLTGNIEINTTPNASSKYEHCLRDTQITSVSGETTLTLTQLQ